MKSPWRRDSKVIYKVKRVSGAVDIGTKWDQGQWQDVEALEIANYMGDKPAHFPKTEAKLVYDEANIYLFFRVEDGFVRSVATEYHGSVWEDSCIEFFFTPGRDISEGYFNIEMNCCGVMLLHHQTSIGQNTVPLAIEDCRKIEIASSIKERTIDPEITEPVTWTLQCRVPIAVLEKYAPVAKPAAGVIWRANFYKCGDQTSHPHWLTWSPVDKPSPNFHLPEFFGEIEFEQY